MGPIIISLYMNGINSSHVLKNKPLQLKSPSAPNRSALLQVAIDGKNQAFPQKYLWVMDDPPMLKINAL